MSFKSSDLATGDEVSKPVQRRSFVPRKPPLYPLNYGDFSRDQRSDLSGQVRPSGAGDRSSAN
jgi:hypothetical protein